MRTFAQKPKATEQTLSTRFTTLNRTPFGKSHEVNSILHLKRTIGNKAVNRLLETNTKYINRYASSIAHSSYDFSRIPLHATTNTKIQPKLEIGASKDACEQEADRVANDLVRPSTPTTGMRALKARSVQEEDERSQNTEGVGGDFAFSSSGELLATSVRDFSEPRFGYNFNRVRVHTDTGAATSTRDARTLAFTVGKDVLFGPGRFPPHTENLAVTERNPGPRQTTLREAVSCVAAAPASTLHQHQGEPLDIATQTAAEHNLGLDFSKVRVHRNDAAASAAEQLGARAFTVGNSIAFATGRYAPETRDGRGLILHELAHVAERSGAVSFQLDPNALPGFNQGEYASCGAASIVTALVVWDRENKDPTAPNNLVVTACDIALVYMDDHKRALIKTWEARHPGKGAELYDTLFAVTQQARDDARVPGAKLAQQQFEEIGLVFYGLYVGGGTGLPRAARESLADMLGIKTGQTNDIATFDDIFTSPILAKLEPGRIAQVSWYVVRGPSTERPGETSLGSHAFLIGRLKERGTWFLSDQGAVPALELDADDLVTLKRKMLGTKRYWTGEPPHTYLFGQPLPIPEGHDQVLLLGERGGVTSKAKTLVLTPGEFLAEVDAGLLTTGSAITAGDFVTRAYSEAEGMKALLAIPAGKGGVMVENPVGLFHVHETSTVSDANLNVTEIDKSDSAGGRLDPDSRHYYSAWLRLSSATACNPKPLKVY